MSGSVNSQYGIGSDTQITIISNGALLVSQILTGFEARQMVAQLDSTALDGVNRYIDIEKGWEGTFEYDRADSVWDDYFAAKEFGRYTGAPRPVVTITETTLNAADNSVSKYRYDGVTLRMETAGRRGGDAKI